MWNQAPHPSGAPLSGNHVTIVTRKDISPNFVIAELIPYQSSARRGTCNESEQYTEQFEPFEFEQDAICTIHFSRNLKGSLSKSNILFDEMDNELA